MRIHSVTIAVPNPQQTGLFFRDKLELPISSINGAVAVKVGASTLYLEEGNAEPNGYYHLAFEIPENTITQARDLLRNRMALLLNGDRDIKTADPDWDSHSVYFNAPGNLNLELIARHRKPNAIQTPFAFQDIQYISEVGIPVEDTPHAVQQLNTALSLDPFIPSSETFAPVGTDDGLIIIVRQGRIWYPTEDQTTTSRPLNISITGVTGELSLTPNATITGISSAE